MSKEGPVPLHPIHPSSKFLSAYRWLMAVGWSVFVLLISGFVLWQSHQNTLALAKALALSSFEKA